MEGESGTKKQNLLGTMICLGGVTKTLSVGGVAVQELAKAEKIVDTSKTQGPRGKSV